MKKVTGWQAGALLLALTTVVAGCSSSADETAGSASPTASQEAPPADPTRGPDPTASAATPSLVEREGAAPERVAASAADLATPDVIYGDGLKISITKVTQGTIEGQGAGEITGDPYTVFDVEVTNNSPEPVDTSRVVAGLTYGEPPAQARTVYLESSKDLSGTVEPGKSAQANYAFSIPVDQLNNVTLSLDIDGRHGLAVFTGEVSQ